MVVMLSLYALYKILSGDVDSAQHAQMHPDSVFADTLAQYQQTQQTTELFPQAPQAPQPSQVPQSVETIYASPYFTETMAPDTQGTGIDEAVLTSLGESVGGFFRKTTHKARELGARAITHVDEKMLEFKLEHDINARFSVTVEDPVVQRYLDRNGLLIEPRIRVLGFEADHTRGRVEVSYELDRERSTIIRHYDFILEKDNRISFYAVGNPAARADECQFSLSGLYHLLRLKNTVQDRWEAESHRMQQHHPNSSFSYERSPAAYEHFEHYRQGFHVPRNGILFKEGHDQALVGIVASLRGPYELRAEQSMTYTIERYVLLGEDWHYQETLAEKTLKYRDVPGFRKDDQRFLGKMNDAWQSVRDYFKETFKR